MSAHQSVDLDVQSGFSSVGVVWVIRLVLQKI